jgi:hypothetical protein
MTYSTASKSPANSSATLFVAANQMNRLWFSRGRVRGPALTRQFGLKRSLPPAREPRTRALQNIGAGSGDLCGIAGRPEKDPLTRRGPKVPWMCVRRGGS